jgi:hypothetical protein
MERAEESHGGDMTALMLDYDGPLPQDLIYRIRYLAQTLHWRIGEVRVDKTRRGYHVVVDVKKRLPFAIVVAAQALLGSDVRREIYNLRRAVVWDLLPAFWRARCNVLYGEHEHEVPR